MTFLYPAFLLASFTIIIPIIIHLFNFRQHKVVYFSNVKFLKDIKEETKSKSRLKNLLILLSRILTILMLVIAFSQPFIPNENISSNIKKNQIGIYLDNSFSMNSEGKYGNIHETAKNKAFNILDAYSNNTNLIFLDNNLKSNHLHIQNKETVKDFIINQKISPKSKSLSEINSTFLNLFAKDTIGKKQIYYISDFQKTNSDFENLSKDSNINYIFIPLPVEKNNNLYIDSVWFEEPFRTFGKEEKLFAKIVNFSDESYIDIPVNLYINDSLKTISSLNIEPNSSETIELDYTNTKKGILSCKIELDDYPITFDNSFYFTYQIIEKFKLLIINEKTENKFLKKLFENDENFEVENFNSDNIKPSEFINFNTIIINQIKEFTSGLISELNNYVAAGGTVLFIPNLEGEIESYNELLNVFNSNTLSKKDTTNTKIEKINLENIIFKDVFKEIDENSEFPMISEYFLFNKVNFSNDISLIESDNNTNILSVNNYEKGLFYVLNITIDDKISNFVKHPLFVPTLYNIAIYSNSNNQIYYKIGKDNIISIDNITSENIENLHLIKKEGDYEFIPQIVSSNKNTLKLNLMQNISEAGNYNLKVGEEILSGLSFNYPRTESILEFYSDIEISEKMKEQNISNFTILSNDNISIEQELKQLNEGTKLWKYFILLALFFIAIEIVLIKLWK